MTAFIGVRISWLILARKSLLAMVADSASCLALISSSRESSAWITWEVVAASPIKWDSSSGVTGCLLNRAITPIGAPSEETRPKPANETRPNERAHS